jgi:hypothetical protein
VRAGLNTRTKQLRQRGASLVEYSFLITFLMLASAPLVYMTGTGLGSIFDEVNHGGGSWESNNNQLRASPPGANNPDTSDDSREDDDEYRDGGGSGQLLDNSVLTFRGVGPDLDTQIDEGPPEIDPDVTGSILVNRSQ